MKRSTTSLLTLIVGSLLLLTACGGRSTTVTSGDSDESVEYVIHDVLPKDAIPAIFNPQFLTREEAEDFYDQDELVIGVVFDGDARAYSVPLLSGHEIVNDTVGGVKIAVTW